MSVLVKIMRKKKEENKRRRMRFKVNDKLHRKKKSEEDTKKIGKIAQRNCNRAEIEESEYRES